MTNFTKMHVIKDGISVKLCNIYNITLHDNSIYLFITGGNICSWQYNNSKAANKNYYKIAAELEKIKIG